MITYLLKLWLLHYSAFSKSKFTSIKRIALSLLLASFHIICFQAACAQNLVPNPGFENVIAPSCQLTNSPAHFTGMINDWFLATNGTADLRTTLVNPNCLTHCLSTNANVHGIQAPFEGRCMVGLYTYGLSAGAQDGYREYVEIELSSPLEPGEVYYCEMHVSKAENFVYVSNNLGMYFSDTMVQNPIHGPLNVKPQVNLTTVAEDSTGWIKVAGKFLATSKSRYLVLGNFFTDNETSNHRISSPRPRAFGSAYYFIDFVRVLKTKPFQSIDTVICEGDTVELNEEKKPLIRWSLKSSPNTIYSTDTILRVSPTDSQSYLFIGTNDTIIYNVKVLRGVPDFTIGDDTVTLCHGQEIELSPALPDMNILWSTGSTDASIKIRDTGLYWVSVSNECDSKSDTIIATGEGCECKVFIPNVFTPNLDSINENFSPEISCAPEEYHLQIYNRWGELLFESHEYENKWDGTYRGRLVPEGVYFWIVFVKSDKKLNRKGRQWSGTITLLR